MDTTRFTRAGVTLALLGLTACHLRPVTELPQLDFTRMPEPRVTPPLRPDAPVEVRSVRIHAFHAERQVVPIGAALRVVPGSQCRMHVHPVCGPRGDCLASVLVHGEVCVLLVRATAHTGDELDPYCHDLSRPRLGTGAASEPRHAVWERCLRDLPSQGVVRPAGGPRQDERGLGSMSEAALSCGEVKALVTGQSPPA